MLKFKKKIISLITSLTVSSSIFIGIPITTEAVTTENSISTEKSSKNYNLPEDVKDGVILHAWNWSFNQVKEHIEEIAECGYGSVQVSPIQPNKDSPMQNTSQWWKLYQPINFTIGNDLGTAEEFKAMCDEAHKYGVKIIVDVVSNHLANKTNGYDKSEQIPDYIRNNSNYWHSSSIGKVNDSSRYQMTQGNIGMPDLNTGNTEIQNMVIKFLNEAQDLGADGFRFDAAKHIELPTDGNIASDFWPRVINAIKSKDSNSFVYGEILGTAGTSIENYTKYIKVTDCGMGYDVRKAIYDTNVSLVQNYTIDKASNAITWVESHDTYANDEHETTYMTDEQIKLGWGLIGARNKSVPLFFVRPTSMNAALGSYTTLWQNKEIVEVNKFHNYFEGKSEYVRKLNNNSVFAVERGGEGVVLTNLGSGKAKINTETTLKDGTYIDTVSGASFTVYNGKLSGEISGRKIAVLYNSNTPINKGTVTFKYIDKETKKEIAEPVIISGGVGTKFSHNLKDIDGYEFNCSISDDKLIFTEEPITITYEYSKYAKGNVIIKYVNADTKEEIETSKSISGKIGTSYTTEAKDIKGYELVELPNNASGVYTENDITVIYLYKEKEFNTLKVHYYNKNNWSNVYLYTYAKVDGVTVKYTGNWPGTKMTNEGNGWWSFEVTDAEEAYIMFNNNNGSQEPAANQSGYEASGEVWVKDKKVLYKNPDAPETGKVIVKYIDEETGEILKTIKLEDEIGKDYKTESLSIDGYTLKTIPTNSIGKFTKGDIEVIYKYSKDVLVPTIESFTPDKASPQLQGTNIKLTVKASGKGTLQYKFIIKDDKGNWYKLRDFSTSNTYVWKASASGNKKLYVDVKDEFGNVVREELNYKIIASSNLEIQSFTVDKTSPQVKGTNVKLTVKASGKGTLQYKFIIKDDKGNWYKLRDFSTSNTYVWKTTVAGSKKLYVDVKDEDGKVVRKELNYVVK